MTKLSNLEFDAAHIWHPYTSVSNPPLLHEVTSAKGVRLTLADGREVVDGMSSWWSAIHGYNHPKLNEAAHQQIDTMSHVMFGGLTHEPAVNLARKLVEITDDSLQYVFLADSGSVSVEVAIKMAIQYWFAQNKPEKHRLLTFRNGYHGDTFGAMSVCDPVNGMHKMFEKVLPTHLFAAAPECRDDADWQDSYIEDFKHLVEKHHHELAAVIVEPLVQGAGGMRIYCAEYLRQIRALCDEYHILLIFDEIATGFGRTGSLFAYEQAGIVPDIICMGKALTGGYMTLAAVMCNQQVADGIAADGSGVLMHGPTFMANPLACRVAAASIDLLLESDWQTQVSTIENSLNTELTKYRDHELVKDVRVKGAIGVVELKKPLDDAMDWLPGFIVEQGVWIRPFRTMIYIMPPYIIDTADLQLLCDAIFHILNALNSTER
ncbi:MULTISPECIES: adenosylmethionine--8-amino-7-oxononanoate transaminase [Methylophaga]|jgi:adenosylmethionine-8-amino-7-oxononanoate aminotransferase|uniref:Adenosylmethionine-8-amino-7-oxononanoate aminotransferase n=1 Tax=Methylophaga marina TaxID=45495 RepID=A0ABN0TFA1_9GAMM|nr:MULTISPECIES: adenosylmethionine--8-amino-7-oxononanoate transaminase [Methylophaga]BDZ72733.1 adenosylmethionine-8-amino-7-oxononanoate aminotransferase [Methylophaga marina]|tara:strand:+ start:569 stop:1870 length:1302 start_codon:yes stop_codon:yes gene_type:complete